MTQWPHSLLFTYTFAFQNVTQSFHYVPFVWKFSIIVVSKQQLRANLWNNCAFYNGKGLWKAFRETFASHLEKDFTRFYIY